MRIRIIISLVVVALFFFIVATPTQALTVIDQQNGPGVGYATENQFQQGITAGMCGELDSIEIYFNWMNYEDVVLDLYSGAPLAAGPIYTTQFTPIEDAWNNVMMEGAGRLNLESGDMFTIGIRSFVKGEWVGVNLTTSDDYAEGELWSGGLVYDDKDMVFRTYMSECPVPEPTTVALLGIGLVGLIGGAARKKLKKKAIAKTQVIVHQ